MPQELTIRSERGKRRPAINVKVYKGLESLTPENWRDIREQSELDSEVASQFGPEWIDAYQERKQDAFYEWWNDACQSQFEMAEEDAKALFGDSIECFLEGRSGGWLVVEGLPDTDDWGKELRVGSKCPDCGETLGTGDIKAEACNECEHYLTEEDGFFRLPNLKDSRVEGCKLPDGTELPNDATLLQRWAAFERICREYADDVPYQFATLLVMNVFDREEKTRPVEFLRAWTHEHDRGGRRVWDTLSADIPAKIKGDACVAYVKEKDPSFARPSGAVDEAFVAVYKDHAQA